MNSLNMNFCIRGGLRNECLIWKDRDSMPGRLNLTNKSDFKALKLSHNSKNKIALKRDTQSSLELVHKHKGNVVVNNLSRVNNDRAACAALRDSLQQGVPYPTSEPEGCDQERKGLYTKKFLLDCNTPELVPFYEEHNYQFVKDILMHTQVPSLHSEQNSDVESNSSESTNGTLEKVSSMSIQSEHRVVNYSRKDGIKEYGSSSLMMEHEEDCDTRNNRLIDCSIEVAGRETDLAANSMVPLSATEAIIDDNSHKGEPSSEPEESRNIIHHSDSLKTKDKVLDTSRAEDEISEIAGSCKRLDHEHDEGDLHWFSVGPVSGSIVPYSGNISPRSNSSTASSHSFVFPTLPSEWNGSPVRMAKAERRQLRKHQSWRTFFPCCKF